MALRQSCFGGIAPADRIAVAGEVFGTGEHRLWVGEILALIAFDESGTQQAGQIGILAEGFADASPAQIARDV